MRILVLLVALLLPLTLASCTTVTPEQCQSGNWAGIGAADGQAGRSASHLANHAKVCARVGIVPDQAAWETGRQQGLKLYCTTQNAYAEGRDGRSLSRVCPEQRMQALTRANRWGQEYHDISESIERREDRADDLRRKINSFSKPLTPEDQILRQQYRSELSNVQFDIFQLEIEQRRYARLPASMAAA
jgi:hypothetical protein